MAERDPDSIKQDIDQARLRLASTVDLLAERAHPRRIADDAKARVLALLKTPVVSLTLAGVGALTVVVIIRRIRSR